MISSELHQVGSSCRVLLVDDDSTACATFAIALHEAGFDVTVASSGRDGIVAAVLGQFDIAILDLDLPDVWGLDVARVWHVAGCRMPFIVISGYNSAESSRIARELGASRILDKPVWSNELPVIVKASLKDRGPDRILRVNRPHSESRSAADRWSQLVLKAVRATTDPHTLRIWAYEAGLAYASLRDACYIVGLSARHSRDFARALRAVVRANAQRQTIESLLIFRDTRTMKAFCGRAGFKLGKIPPIEEYFQCQQFIPRDSEPLKTLKRHMRVANFAIAPV